MQEMGFYLRGLSLVISLGIFSGCTSIPERELENAFKTQRLKPATQSFNAPIKSEYQDYADQAWDNHRRGEMEHYASLLEIGDDALLARIHLIRSAQKTIDLQTFVWHDDPTCQFLFDELVCAAKRGVLVRILIDALNKSASVEQLARMAYAHRNIQICLYRPLADRIEQGRIGFWENLFFKTKRANRRMHNKLLLIDGRIGVIGGRNYDGKYYDRHSEFLFRDRDIVVAGSVVQDMENSFEIFWQDKYAVFLTQFVDVHRAYEKQGSFEGNFLSPAHTKMFEEVSRLADEYSLQKVRASLKVYEVDEVDFVADTPRKFRSKSKQDFDEWFAEIGAQAKSRLVYQTPYLIYDRKTRKGFRKLHKRNHGFRIIASSNSLAAADHLHTYALSFKNRKELYKKSGIDIYESKPHPADRGKYVHNYAVLAGAGRGPRLCIHSKSFVVDGKVAMIGSHNFDPRSDKLNSECGLFIKDVELAARLEDLILEACEPGNSWTVSKAKSIPVVSYFSGMIGAISTALPLFDIWPYRYTTNYQLNEGAKVLPPRHPDFLKNYTDVGYFPEVEETGTELKTQLMKAFFGWARPLM